MDKIKIEVTQEDINDGTYYSANSCPIALAAKRKFPQASLISIGSAHGSIFFKPKKFLGFTLSKRKSINFILPRSAQTFITNFDAYGRRDRCVKPFTFEAEVDLGE